MKSEITACLPSLAADGVAGSDGSHQSCLTLRFSMQFCSAKECPLPPPPLPPLEDQRDNKAVMVLNEAFLCCVWDSLLAAPSSAVPRPSPPAAEAHGPLCFCAFIGTQTRGERVLGTCLDHIFVTRESGTVVIFSRGAGHGCSPSPRSKHNRRIVCGRPG